MAAVVRTFSSADARLLVTGDHAVADAGAAPRLVEISHEALIREWQPLKDWVEANRDTLRRRERVLDWHGRLGQGGRDPSLLLPPGLALEVGRKLLDDHGDVLIDEVRALCRGLARRRRRAPAAGGRGVDAERQRELAAAQRLAEEQRKRTRWPWPQPGSAAGRLAGWQAGSRAEATHAAQAERDRAGAD